MAENYSLLVSRNIRADMAWCGTTQKLLAAHLGLSQNAVSMRLLGRTQWTIDELMSVAAFLDTDITRLLGLQPAA